MNLKIDQSIEPDVAFGLIPGLGIAAATADDRPFPDEVLRRHRFLHSPAHDVYLLPMDTPPAHAISAVGGATLELQEAGLTVAADPKIMRPFASPGPTRLSPNAPELSASTPVDRPHVSPPPTRAAAAIEHSPHRAGSSPTEDPTAKAPTTKPASTSPHRSR